MKVWCLIDVSPYEGVNFVAVYATEELAKEAAAREQFPGDFDVWEEDVLTELPPAPPRPPAKRPYQPIP